MSVCLDIAREISIFLLLPPPALATAKVVKRYHLADVFIYWSALWVLIFPCDSDHAPASPGNFLAKEIPAHAVDRICELPLSNFDFEFETRGPLLTCRARKQEAKTGIRSRVRDKADGLRYGEKWPRLPSEATWMLHLLLSALPFQELAPKEARKANGQRED